jgi:hypothetical protein
LIFISTPLLAVAPVVSPSTPVVTQSGTVQFSETAHDVGTWACSATSDSGTVNACTGSINSGTGLYTARALINPQHTYGGLQIGGNNEIYNTRIDSMPVNPHNASWMAAVNSIGGEPTFFTDFPYNYVVPGNTDILDFTYTPLNNGTFEVPAFPNAKSEHGWFSNLQGLSDDHHVMMVDTTTVGSGGMGTLSELYQYYPDCVTTAASVTGNVATITCSKNPMANEFLVGSTITITGFTGADTYFNLASTTIASVTSTSISYNLNHANGTASTNGAAGKGWANSYPGTRNSQSGIKYNSMDYNLPQNNSTDAAGMELQKYILSAQEVEQAVASNGSINHAFRNTYALGVEASSSIWPATTFATDGFTVPFGAGLRLQGNVNISTYSVTAQKILTAIRNYGMYNADAGQNLAMTAELTRWPKVYYDALTEIGNSSIRGQMEFFDPSSIMVSTSSALTTHNRETVTFTRISDNATASVDVALNGPAVNFAQDVLYIQAGTPAQQLPVLNNYGGYSCVMNPSTGTLTSGCLYTPPATLNVATTTVITATSSVNSSVASIMTLTVFPNTGIYVIPSKTSDYTDTAGHVWVNRTGISDQPDNQGCCSCDNSAHFPTLTNISLWNCSVGSNSVWGWDTKMNFLVPNGTYQVIYNYGTQYTTGGQLNKLSVGNKEVYYDVDMSTVAGGQYEPFVSTTTAVFNNQLNVGIWNMNDAGAPVSSLSIIQMAGPPLILPPISINGHITIKGKASIR